MSSQQEPTYSISELAREFGITNRSIRFYEDKGLLKPARRGQTRVYTKRDRVRLKLVLRGKRLGFSLAETQRLFELYDLDRSSATQLEAMLTMIDEKKAQLRQQMEDIKGLLTELHSFEKRGRDALSAIRSNEATS